MEKTIERVQHQLSRAMASIADCVRRFGFLVFLSLLSIFPLPVSYFFGCKSGQTEDWKWMVSSFHETPVQTVLFSIAIFVTIAAPASYLFPFLVQKLLDAIKVGSLVDQHKSKQNKTSENVAQKCVRVSLMTSVQGVLWIILAMYTGNVSIWGSKNVSIWRTLFTCVWQCLFCLFLADLSSYGYHRLAHEWRWLYKTIHYLHHENKYPEHGFFALQYGTFVDMWLSNMCFFCPILYIQTNLAIVFLYGLVSSTLVAAGHSGVELPSYMEWLIDTKFHALHHSRFNVNYAEHLTITDRLFNSFEQQQ